MAKNDSGSSDYVKKEVTLVVAFLALVVGFLGGLMYSAYQGGGPGAGRQVAAPPPPGASAPPAAGREFSQAEASRLLQLQKEVSTDPRNADAWAQLGHLYFDNSQYAKAITAYNKSLEVRPDDPNVWTDLGVMYRRNGQPRKALEAFDRAIEIDPRHQQSRFNKGVVLRYDLNDRQGAVEAWENLLEINPSATTPNGQPLRDAIENL